jgi:hypothetical protein
MRNRELLPFFATYSHHTRRQAKASLTIRIISRVCNKFITASSSEQAQRSAGSQKNANCNADRQSRVGRRNQAWATVLELTD